MTLSKLKSPSQQRFQSVYFNVLWLTKTRTTTIGTKSEEQPRKLSFRHVVFGQEVSATVWVGGSRGIRRRNTGFGHKHIRWFEIRRRHYLPGRKMSRKRIGIRARPQGKTGGRSTATIDVDKQYCCWRHQQRQHYQCYSSREATTYQLGPRGNVFRSSLWTRHVRLALENDSLPSTGTTPDQNPRTTWSLIIEKNPIAQVWVRMALCVLEESELPSLRDNGIHVW